ncbi:SDR family oxidoreductase [Actinospica sp. MGRD01-02]|uniref:SDR family oxidoreductase n=1 Tax=Actinospica acidithermotolerans TaxID=2828514 RepID=A0A941EFU7_9ACTN|nr:SDR family NAD(P)-dependent oxidoreductase [Actinospica acidithermotolerans]MBR7830686.1 SDR family oxidoreductase [Actinospica acidithermotolerans]
MTRGARVYLTGRRKQELDAAVAAIGRGAIGVQGDVSRPTDLDRLYERISEDGCRMDVLYANAGVGQWAPLEQVTVDHLDFILGVNVRGAVFTVQKAVPLLNDHASVILSGRSGPWRAGGIRSLFGYEGCDAVFRPNLGERAEGP